ncbi:hypothetical protein JCM18916_704 [Cutibacterium acnes JCM 18916]|nr:hypothetical protein JCM18916_704 [Cutibacterium acnes JCM 18916]
MNAAGTYFLLTAAGITKISITTVDEDITRLEERGDLFNDGIGAAPRLNHHDDATRALEAGYEIGQVMEGRNVPSLPCPAITSSVRDAVRL